MRQFYESTIIDIQDESPTTKRFTFQAPHKFEFIPGQFVVLDVPIQEKKTNRSYSISSPPKDNTFELLIVLNEKGLCTPYMWENYKIGTKVLHTGPVGKFILPEKIEHDLCLICTGTGIAPFRSMVKHIFTNNIPHKNIYLIFGNRKIPDILYKKEFEKLSQKNPELKFIPVLSREPDFIGKKGYVHPVYEEIFKDTDPAHFFICGWREMVKEARDRILNLGYSKQSIKFELYD